MDLVTGEEHGGLEGKDGLIGLETEHTVKDTRCVLEVGRAPGVSCVQDEVVNPPPEYRWEAQYVATRPLVFVLYVRRVNR